jgi:hypothetical protein
MHNSFFDDELASMPHRISSGRKSLQSDGFCDELFSIRVHPPASCLIVKGTVVFSVACDSTTVRVNHEPFV